MTATTTNVPGAWAPDVISMFDADDKIGDALLITASSKAGEIDGDSPRVLVPYLQDAPQASFVPEGDNIELSDIQAAEAAIDTFKIAVVTRVSRELTEQSGAASRIADSLRRSVVRKADEAFLNNPDAPVGLLQVPDVEVAGDLGADIGAAFDAVAAIEGDGGEATNLLISPADWATLSKLPEATGSNRSLLSDPHDAAHRSLAGVPVTVHASVAQGTALMLDKSEVISAYGALQLARSDEAFFTSDAVGVRLTWRVGFSVIRPARLQKLTVGA